MNTLVIDYLLTLTIAGSAVSLCTLAVCVVLRHKSAALRHLLVTGTLLGLLILPLVILAGPTVALPVLPRSAVEAPPGPAVAVDDSWSPLATEGESATDEIMPADRLATEKALGGAVPFGTVVAWVYLSGLLLTLIPIGVGMYRVSRSLRSARPAPELPAGLPSGAIALVAPRVRTPFVWGWLRPVLVLPEQSTEWGSSTFRDVLLHELAHVDRFDGLSQMLGRFALAVHWYNPLVWILMRTMLLDAERACDDRVLEAGTDAAEYAERLLAIAANTGRRSLLDEIAAVAMARPTQLVTRIETLLDERVRRWKLPAGLVAITIIGMVSAVSAAAMIRFDESPGRMVATDSVEPTDAPIDDLTDGVETDWARVEGRRVMLKGNTQVEVEGWGEIVLENNKRTLVVSEAVLIWTGDGRDSPIKLYSESGRNAWVISPVGEVPDEPGSRIVDSDRRSSTISAREGVLFYLYVDAKGKGVYFEPRSNSKSAKIDWNDPEGDGWAGDVDVDPDVDIDLDWDVDVDPDIDPDWDVDVDPDIDPGWDVDVDPDIESSWDFDEDWEEKASPRADRSFRNASSPRRGRSATIPRTRPADDSPLYTAVRTGDVEMVELLLERGLSPDERWPGDGNPLIVATHNGDREMVEALLRAGADPDAGVTGDGNALIEAASHGNLPILKLLVEAGGDVDVGVGGDGNPLIAAARRGDIDMLDYLLDIGAEIDKVVPGDENALITAAEAGQLEAVRYLVARGADVNVKVPARNWRTGKREIRTALSRALDGGHDQIVAYLRSVGARE